MSAMPLRTAALLAALLLSDVLAAAQSPSSLETVSLRTNFFVVAGAGGNVGVQVGSDGVIVVDTGSGDRSDALLDAIRRISDRPIRYVINTNADADHVGGNAAVAHAGRTIFNAGNALGAAMTNGGAAGIIAFETVLFRMSGREGGTAYPAAAWPTDAHSQERRALYLNDEGVEFLHQPAAHGDGDLAVFFRRSDVVMAGDVIDATRFPVIDLARGGSIDGEIASLNRLVDLAIASVPFVWKAEGTYVVPGHGRVYRQADVVHYRDMVVIVRDRVRDLMTQGLSLAEIQAANPTQGYRTAFGSDTGPWTTAMFVEAVYRSLSRETR
jgi:glyoxylase-like metal-dependent hydrolase (beta-lactamase superfamily II)